MNGDRVNQIIDAYGGDRTSTLAMLQDIQREYNYLPREALELIARRLELPPGHVYQMATFFKAFSLSPKGEHICKVCLGTACHVKGGAIILEALEREFKVKSGSTTADGKLSVEGVRCLGACALAPIVVVDDEPHGQMSSDTSIKLVQEVVSGQVAKAPAPAEVKPAVVRAAVDLSAVPPAG
jgi:NADH-quinone oxidoreductase subunit E